MEYHCHLEQTDLQAYIHNVFGSSYHLAKVEQMHGGAQKVVYKVTCTNGFSCVLYVWDIAMNYFQREIESGERGAISYGSDQFAQNNRYLHQLGVRTPILYDVNQDRSRYSFDYALVEYVNGQLANTLLHDDADTDAQEKVFSQAGEMLARMHADTQSTYGSLVHPRVNTEPCHRSLLKNARTQLAYAAQHIESMAAHQSKLLAILDELESRIQPRNHYGFVHGELGPEHIMVNDKLEPYFIDIEGAMYFDIEHEHSYLAFRFDEHYRYFNHNSLDPDRMEFYAFHHHISYMSGGLQLLHRGFYNEPFAKNIVEYNSRCVLNFLDGNR